MIRMIDKLEYLVNLVSCMLGQSTLDFVFIAINFVFHFKSSEIRSWKSLLHPPCIPPSGCHAAYYVINWGHFMRNYFNIALAMWLGYSCIYPRFFFPLLVLFARHRMRIMYGNLRIKSEFLSVGLYISQTLLALWAMWLCGFKKIILFSWILFIILSAHAFLTLPSKQAIDYFEHRIRMLNLYSGALKEIPNCELRHFKEDT